MDTGARGISPVVGIALLIVIVTLLGAVSATMVFDLSEEREPAPNVAFELEPGEDGITHEIVHEGGETLDGDKVTIQGVAESTALDGRELVTGEAASVIPTDEEITLVYTGEHGTTYTLWTAQPETSVPAPDEGCEWVESESDNGTESVKVDGLVVDCDVTTDKGVEVYDSGAIIGDTESQDKTIDVDDAKLYGDATAEDTVNIMNSMATGTAVSTTADVKIDNSSISGSLQGEEVVEVINGGTVEGDATAKKTVKIINSTATGTAVSTTADVKIDNSSISGSLQGQKVVEVSNGGTVEGDAVSTNKNVKIVGGSTIGGDAVSTHDQVKVDKASTVEGDINGDSVELTDATVEGDVYTDGDFKCTNSTINGQSCDSYSPKDSDDY
ncbi:MAG: type IV pilin [Halapricum sp.]